MPCTVTRVLHCAIMYMMDVASKLAWPRCFQCITCMRTMKANTAFTVLYVLSWRPMITENNKQTFQVLNFEAMSFSVREWLLQLRMFRNASKLCGIKIGPLWRHCHHRWPVAKFLTVSPTVAPFVRRSIHAGVSSCNFTSALICNLAEQQNLNRADFNGWSQNTGYHNGHEF